MSHMNLGNNDKSVHVLRDIEVPKKYFHRIKTGVQVLDEVFGGNEMPGIIPGASVLFTGFPGAGKSTMALQLADLMQSFAGRNVLYNVGEENAYMVKMRADRMSIMGNFCISHFEDVNDLFNYAVENDIEVLFQDSLQTLTMGELEGSKLIKAVGHALAKFASEKNVTTFIVGQITKGGDFAGPMQIKHAVDAHCHLSLNKETGNRIFELQKNRFGPAMMPYEFFMSGTGLDFRQVEDPETRVKKTNASRRKEAFVEKAKELLLRGEKLSGYSHIEHPELGQWIADEAGGDCSGSWWRGILTKAVSELEREGNKFMTAKIDRRDTVWMEC